MKRFFYSVLFLGVAGVLTYSISMARNNRRPAKIDGVPKTFHELSLKSLDGQKEIHMKDYAGKYVLCVNVASRCGYTPQYEGLQKLSEKFAGKLVVIGFPCNQFMGQEPGTADEIAAFCSRNYGVTFPITEKINVKGESQHAVYTWLTQKALNGKADVTIKWNFNKILIGPDGSWLSYFPSGTEPMSEEITSLIK